MGKFSVRFTYDELQERLNNLFPDNELEILSYSGMRQPMSVKCNKCGWEHSYAKGESLFYKNKVGCPQCHGPNRPRLTIEEAQNRVDEIFGQKEYQIINFEKESAPLTIRHKCGFIFQKTKLHNLIKSMGCPKCKSNASKGESEIAKILKKWKIPFQTEFIFKDLYGKSEKGKLRFDFAILSPFMLIEFDGPQHFEEGHYENDFIQQQENDKKKNEYCKEHNIPLLRIPYWDFKNIPILLKNFLILNDYPFGEYSSSEEETLDTKKGEDIV